MQAFLFNNTLHRNTSPFGQTNTKPPNIIVILADHLGWADLGCYGSSFYETPNLDKLAANGIKFENGYAASPVCSLSKACIMTGKYPVKTGINDWIKGRQDGGKAKPFEKMIAKPSAFQLPHLDTTIAQIALSNGYKTFFAGKWHLGENENFCPEKHGFQTNIGGNIAGGPKGKINDSLGGFFTPHNNPQLPDGPIGEYITDRLANECIAILEKQIHEPFLMMYSLYAVHNPLQEPMDLVRKYEAKRTELGLKDQNSFAKDEDWMQNQNDWKRMLIQDHAVYAAMVEKMDANIGRIWEKLKQKGLEENTVIIFTSY